jgi:two-component system chemotaxis response regulator CheY
LVTRFHVERSGHEADIPARQNARRTALRVAGPTTESSDDMKSKGKAAGATGWLVKPFDPNKLLEVIKRVIR